MTVSGNPLDYLAAFWGGVLLSFTPCVYPIIPITIGAIGIKAGGSKLKGLVLSLIYVSGIAIVYSALGIIAALSGKLFGSISANPITHILVGSGIILFGLSMLDVFSISLPNIVKLPDLKKKNYFSTFLIGLSSGFILGPCITPALGAILAYVATKQNILYGAALLFSFAYGMGALLIIIGTFSGILVNLPKSGKFSLYIKRFYAAALLIMGGYFIIKALARILG